MGQKDNTNDIPNKSKVQVEETPFIGGSQPARAPDIVKKPPSWKENLDYYFSQYCSATSIHGVQYVGERGRYAAEKIFWSIIIIIVWCLCIILISKTYNKWVTSPVIVTFATTETPISSIPFPAITICPQVKSDPDIFNYTKVFVKKLQEIEVTPEEEEWYEAFSLVCSGFATDLSQAGHIAQHNRTVDDIIFKHLSEAFPGVHNFTDARWGGTSLDLDNLSESISSDGFCYSFNMLDYSEIYKSPTEYIPTRSGESRTPQKWSLDGGYPDENIIDTFPRRSFLSGIDGGFQILLPTLRSHLDFVCGDMLQGFKVTLHHPCETPDMDQHFRVPLDQAVFVAIKPRMTAISEELKSYKTEERKCYFADERVLSLFQSYTQSNCLVECLSNYTFSKCGCIPFYMPGKISMILETDSPVICGSGSNDCIEESKVNYLINSKCNCLPSCTSLEYDVEISQTDSSWRKMFKVLENVNPKFKEYLDHDNLHMSMVTVYYKEMQFLTSERHQLYGYVDFFSNTGGLLGLFIGFSVTSAVEILYFLTIRLWCNIRKFGKRYWSGEKELMNAENNQQPNSKDI